MNDKSSMGDKDEGTNLSPTLWPVSRNLGVDGAVQWVLKHYQTEDFHQKCQIIVLTTMEKRSG